eukprot:TRINITY_DN2459_c0_g1_i1.p1 TRINITY_DN2459_c0_g1~~TRINITY_DN2459_c0_g1_i1.p1  ORF type:complete len:212 (+),score=29.92 TRINITY_DN2459_c0_g1_i1:137-772(+)
MIKSTSLSPTGEEFSPNSDWNGVRSQTIDEYSSDIFEGTDDTPTPSDSATIHFLADEIIASSYDCSHDFVQFEPNVKKKKMIKFGISDDIAHLKQDIKPGPIIQTENIRHNPLFNNEKLRKLKAIDSANANKEEIHVNPLYNNQKLRNIESTSPNSSSIRLSISSFNIFRRKSNPYEGQNTTSGPPTPLFVLRNSLRKTSSASDLFSLEKK